MIAFSKKKVASHTTVVKLFNKLVYTFRFNKELKADSIILKSFTIVAKLLFLLNATIFSRYRISVEFAPLLKLYFYTDKAGSSI